MLPNVGEKMKEVIKKMTNKKGTKRSLLMSALAMLLCVSMLIGSTFAFFTDSVTSAGNIIKSGTLDISMNWAKGTEDPAAANWQDASTTKIFNYDQWEPGYTEVRHIKIANVGTLALKYQLNILPNGEASKLTDAIDVYYLDPATQLSDRASIDAQYRLGTLTEVLAGLLTVTVLQGIHDGTIAHGCQRGKNGDNHHKLNQGETFLCFFELNFKRITDKAKAKIHPA